MVHPISANVMRPPRLHANVLDGWLASQTRYVVDVKLRCVKRRF